MARSIAQAVGGFVEALPGSGEAEDLIFFQKHLALHYAENSKHDLPPILARGRLSTQPRAVVPLESSKRVVSMQQTTFASSSSAGVRGADLIHAELGKVCRLGAGRDAKNFMNEISSSARTRVAAMIDIDPRKTGRQYTNSQVPDQSPVPIVHFSKAPQGITRRRVVAAGKKRIRSRGRARIQRGNARSHRRHDALVFQLIIIRRCAFCNASSEF